MNFKFITRRLYTEWRRCCYHFAILVPYHVSPNRKRLVSSDAMFTIPDCTKDKHTLFLCDRMYYRLLSCTVFLFEFLQQVVEETAGTGFLTSRFKQHLFLNFGEILKSEISYLWLNSQKQEEITTGQVRRTRILEDHNHISEPACAAARR